MPSTNSRSNKAKAASQRQRQQRKRPGATPSSVVRKRKGPIRPAHTPKTFLERKKLLEESFSKIHTELGRETLQNLTPPGFNVFMEIMKVKHIIDLDDEASQIEAGETEPQQRADELPKKVGNAEDGEILMCCSDETFSSDFDMRERKHDSRIKSILKRQRQKEMFKSNEMGPANCHVHFAGSIDSGVQSSLKSNTSDIDMRNDIVSTVPDSMAAAAQQSQHLELAPSCSYSNNTNSQNRGNSVEDEQFVSRVRYASRSAPINLTSTYKLLGLRYFQEIPGYDLFELSANDIAIRGESNYTKKSLSVVSFNILCQYSMENTKFLYSHLRMQPYMGTWEFRKVNLFNEFGKLNADVFCLQEVQDIHLESDILPYFTTHGYRSLYTPRAGPDSPDGCAIFWNPNQLELVKSESVSYNLGISGMDKPNVGQIAAFVLAGTRTLVCISNTHIYYNMKRGEVKLAQMVYLLGSMHQMESQIREGRLTAGEKWNDSWRKKPVHFAGHILCGDFNMEPTSPLHRFITERKISLTNTRFDLPIAQSSTRNQQPSLSAFGISASLPVQIHLPVRNMLISGKCTFVGKDDAKALFDPKKEELSHLFTFASVYEHWDELGDPEVSSYHREAVNPDFIFYSVNDQREVLFERNGAGGNALLNEEDARLLSLGNKRELAHESFIRLKKRLSMPTRAQLDRCVGGGRLPNAEYGSDHLALWANFEVLAIAIA